MEADMGFLSKTWFIRKALEKGGEPAALLAVSTLVFAVDQLFKYQIETEPEDNFPREMPHTGGKVTVRRLHNTGFSMSRLKDHPVFVRVTALFCFLLSGIALFSASVLDGHFRIRRIFGAAAVGGAAGNVFDRFVKGSVTDFLHIHWHFLDQQVINLADAAIVIGGIVWAGLSILFPLHLRSARDR